jgi:hypothetical protein
MDIGNGPADTQHERAMGIVDLCVLPPYRSIRLAVVDHTC